MQPKKITLHEETIYLLGQLFMALAVAMVAASDFGLSMIVSPAYLISEWFPNLTFGQGEYIMQGILMVLFCIMLGRVKLTYLFAYVTGLLYGTFLDFWRAVIPVLNPEVTDPATLGFGVRVVLFVLGILLTTVTVVLSLKTYLPAQVYDFFVLGLVKRFNRPLHQMKRVFDFSFLGLSIVMTLVLFHEFRGVGIGTVIAAVANGFLIGAEEKLFDKFVEKKTWLPKLKEKFQL